MAASKKAPQPTKGVGGGPTPGKPPKAKYDCKRSPGENMATGTARG